MSNVFFLPQTKKPLLLLVHTPSAGQSEMAGSLNAEFRLKTATCAASARSACEPEQPSLILLDIKLSDRDLIELVRTLRKCGAAAGVPVILLTGDDSEQRRLAELNLDVDYYLNRSVASKTLTGVLRNLIERNHDRRQALFAAHIFNHCDQAILITDRNNRIVAANEAFTEMTGYGREEVIGLDPKLLSSGHTSREVYKNMWKSIRAEGLWQGELWDRRKDGGVFPKQMTVSVLRDRLGDIEYYVASFADATHFKKTQERINFIAYHDALTGLPNRLYLQEYLRQSLLIAQAESEQVALMLLDLDRFKAVNETHSHSLGDKLLEQAAIRLKHCVRERDLVARLGGDEFAVVLRGKEAVQAVSGLAARIRRQLFEPFCLGTQRLRFSVSIGIALHPENGQEPEMLMKCADTAMYSVKNDGGDDFRFFTAVMNTRIQENLEMETMIHDALEQTQFELYYQPQFSLPDRRLLGAEVLLRWKHPEKGLISPSTFIPLAETTGQICAIGKWVLEQTCLQGNRWLREGVPLPRLAVNVSARQLQREEFTDTVKKTLAITLYPPEKLELEITETALAASPESAARRLHELRTLGIALALDDFGTGYSSLGQLKHMPMDRLKIDRTFVRDIRNVSEPKDGAIAAATIAMGHSLGLNVIAEGVETEAQLAFLLQHGCDAVQGYYFAKPMPASEFESLLRAQKVGSADRNKGTEN
jgi:diguanylate cyclase (GGDEF)-like protein/PAS domain S-box-containing protein